MAFRLRTRFAPTPSGYLHLGNAWSFALTWLAARSRGGHITLRIDDLDAARFRDEYLEDVFASLHWLGLDWDAGPRDAAEFKASYSQRHRLPRYREVLENPGLRERLYACACSREEIRRQRESGHGVYPGTCREAGHLPEPGKHALRFRLDAGPIEMRDEEGRALTLHPHRDMGDFILRQKNGDPSYQLASVVDDQDMGINFAVRGLDLMPSTGAQLALARCLGFGELLRARFWHHGLIVDETGAKLSKSEGAVSLKALRERGGSHSLYRNFAKQLRLDLKDVAGPRDLLEGFRPERAPSNLFYRDFIDEV